MPRQTMSAVRRTFALTVLVVLLGLAASAQKTHPEMLVSTQWLAAHLSDPKLVIIHAGAADQYQVAHIPGARLLTEDKIAAEQEMPRVELLPDDELKANLEAIGLNDDSRIVIYSPEGAKYAARVFFTLDYLGLGDHAALLDGGIAKWNLEKRPTSSETPTVTKGSLTIHPRPEVVAKMKDVQQLTSAANSSVVLIDSRNIERYRDGHLPGAVSFFWEKNLAGPEAMVLRSPDELRKMYVALGAAPGKKIVSYCEVGHQASYTYFVARYLGYDAAMYDGSWTEWSAAQKPAVRGDNPR